MKRSWLSGAMKPTINRRDFLSSCALSLAGLGTLSSKSLAVEAFKRTGPTRLQLSLAAYTFRQFFKPDAMDGKAFDLFQFVDFCAKHGCDGTELTSYYFPKNLDNDYLLRLRRHAFLSGVAVSGTAVGNTFTHPPGEQRDKQIAMVNQWIDHAAVLGAPHIRIFAGRQPKNMSKEEAKKLCIAAIEECGAYAAKKGIFLGIENHGGIVAEAKDLLEIVKAVQCPWVGINLDTGNFHTEDPYGDLELCAPYSVNVQVKVEMRRKGQPKEATDLDRLVKILRNANYQGYVVLEYEAKEDPWTHVPEWLARMKDAFARVG